MENNFLEVQHQVKENSEDLQKYLTDLDSWEQEMKRKENELKLLQKTFEEEIPPIRNSLYRSKRKNRHKKQKEKNTATDKVSISPTDYLAWDKFDADAEMNKLDEEAKHSSTSENSENEDDFSVQKRKQLALLHKDKGNDFFKNGNYDSAINSYTTGILLDPENPLLPANRAMAFLKKEQFQAAENDCDLCLSIDPTYVKAYLRRGTARKNLCKFSLAKDDFSKVLELEPDNKQAKGELKKLSEESSTINSNGVFKNEILEVKDSSPWASMDSYLEKPFQQASRSQVQITEVMEKNAINVDKTLKSKKDSDLNDVSWLEEKFQTAQFEPPLPPVPNNTFQFLTDWNEIAAFPTLRYKYLKQFPPEKLPVFFEHYMEPVIFPKILETLSTSFIENGDDVFDYMKYLTKIGRFTTTIMFLSDKEESDLKQLLQYMKSSKRPESEISEVLKKYQT